MIENLDKLIDKNLNILGGYKLGGFFLNNNFRDLNNRSLSLQSQKRLSQIMQDKGLLIINYGNERIVDITEKGYKIYDNGGWLKFLEVDKLLEQKEQLERQQREVIEKVENQKLIDDAKISKFNAKYRRLPLIFTALGLVISIVSIIIALKSRKGQETGIQLSKSEIVKIIDSISISNQTKKVDSLHNSKNVDSLLKND